MFRRLPVLLVAAACMLLVAAGVSFSANAARRIPFHQTDTGAQISGSATAGTFAYKVSDSVDGTGAAVQVFTVDVSKTPLTGSDKTTSYFANGVSRSVDTFTIGAPDANGISAINGSGHCTGGTGAHRNEKCSYTFSGTYDSKTSRAVVKSKGTYVR